MSVHDGCEVNGAIIDGLLQDGSDSSYPPQRSFLSAYRPTLNVERHMSCS